MLFRRHVSRNLRFVPGFCRQGSRKQGQIRGLRPRRRPCQGGVDRRDRCGWHEPLSRPVMRYLNAPRAARRSSRRVDRTLPRPGAGAAGPRSAAEGADGAWSTSGRQEPRQPGRPPGRRVPMWPARRQERQGARPSQPPGWPGASSAKQVPRSQVGCQEPRQPGRPPGRRAPTWPARRRERQGASQLWVAGAASASDEAGAEIAGSTSAAAGQPGRPQGRRAPARGGSPSRVVADDGVSWATSGLTGPWSVSSPTSWAAGTGAAWSSSGAADVEGAWDGESTGAAR